MICPVKNHKVTCRYGVPGAWKCGYHCGVDLVGESDIYAAADGVITEAAQSPDYGNYIVIAQDDGYSSRYAHLSKVIYAPGRRVGAGDIIGIMGSTGNSTGTHLHFEINRGRMRYPADTDPLIYLRRFPDISEGDFFFEAVLRAAEKGYLQGFPDGSFKPDEPVTRAQLAKVLRRIKKT